MDSERHPPADLRIQSYDPAIVLVVGALMTIGVVMVYSATVTVQGAAFNWRQWWNSPLKQGVFAFAGFLAMIIAAHVDYRVFAWERPRDGWRIGVLTFITLALLVAVLLPGIGHRALGARRAIVIPGISFGFQPSELAKVLLVVWLAALLTRNSESRIRSAELGYGGRPAVLRGDIRHFATGFLPALVSSAALIGLTAVEDFGTAALMGAVMFALLLIAGARWTHLGLTVVMGAAAGALLVIVKPHRVARLATFFSDDPDLAGAGYQVHQSLLAIGSGGWLGRGLGAGVQKYGYLPKDNNDFILAVICEELGVVGGIAIALLFLALLWRGWRVAAHAPDRFGQLLGFGLTLVIALQAAFNIAVVTNSVPTKGISLPFVSAGGSGVIFLGLAAGLLASVGRTTAARDRQNLGAISRGS
jgi:cell division protein FtsW